MTREEKNNIISDLTEQINNSTHLYITDTLGLNADATSDLRRKCFKNNIKLLVVKNTLLHNALLKSTKNHDDLRGVLKGTTSVMFSEVGNAPAKLIQDFRQENKELEKPTIKAAYVEESVYVGHDQLDALVNVKSKDELIGDLILLLKSPINNVISQLNSGKHLLAGITKTLSEREEK